MATLDLKALRHFVSVAESLSFARAAERLGTSQPVVTRTVAQLEHNLGAKLFERTTRRVALTPAGVVLLKAARPLSLDKPKRSRGRSDMPWPLRAGACLSVQRRSRCRP